MSPFLASLRRYLRLIERGVEIDLPARHASFRHALDELRNPEQASEVFQSWRPHIEGWYLDFIYRLSEVGQGRSGPANADVALQRRLGLKVSSGSVALDLELDALARSPAAIPACKPSVFDYATSLQLVHNDRLTRLGRVALELPEGETKRWLLTLEVILSAGEGDRLRVGSGLLSFLIKHPDFVIDYHAPSEEQLTASEEAHIERLEAFGLLATEEDPGGNLWRIDLPEASRTLIEQVLKTPDTPLGVLAMALLQDLSGQRLAAIGIAPSTQSNASITSRLARLVTHEVRNALAPTGYSIDTLRKLAREGGQPEVLLTHIDRVDHAIRRVSAFVDRQHEIAALGDPGELGEAFDPRSAIEEALNDARNGVGAPLSADLAPDLPPVRGARHLLAMAVLNVLRNGLQAVPAGGQVRLRASSSPAGDLRIVVEDDGPGIAESAVPRIFEPGFSTRPNGQGRGLALTRETLEAWGGHIRYEPREGGGARFILTMPRAKP